MAQFSSQRQVIIFKSTLHDSLALQQMKWLQDAAAGVKERDISVLIAEKGNELFEAYKVGDVPFMVILVGKDGLEKYRSTKLLGMEKLFAIIDAMPMRKQEMKNKKE